jgi:hypothetical protein
MDNKDMPAMPLVNECGHPYHASSISWDNTPLTIGLTKREHFAGLAMQGLCHAIDSQGTWAHDAQTVAETAVSYADALLAALDKAK